MSGHHLAAKHQGKPQGTLGQSAHASNSRVEPKPATQSAHASNRRRVGRHDVGIFTAPQDTTRTSDTLSGRRWWASCAGHHGTRGGRECDGRLVWKFLLIPLPFKNWAMGIMSVVVSGCRRFVMCGWLRLTLFGWCGIWVVVAGEIEPWR